MKVTIYVEIQQGTEPWKKALMKKTFLMDSIPEVGHEIVITEGGYSETITAVWWDLTNIPEVKAESAYNKINVNEWDDIIESAKAVGWEVS